ncbi:MAG: hypothetical protein U0990_02570 [Candidatus Nanopelagicales bacterium]|nr:hypothetical protein [Candidatus Nanopelagicales bacterium]
MSMREDVTPTQFYADRFHDAGQLYRGRSLAWSDGLPIFRRALGYALPSWRVQDIDTQDDWERAQLMHTVMLAQERS